MNRREVLIGSAAVAVSAALPTPVAKGVDLGLGEFGSEKYFINWMDKADSDAFAMGVTLAFRFIVVGLAYSLDRQS